MDVPPPRELVAAMRDWAIPRQHLHAVPAHFLRAAWKACLAATYETGYQSASLERWIAERITPLAVWFFSGDLHATADAGLLKAGWPALERRFAEWQKLNAAKAVTTSGTTSDKLDEWPPFVRKVEWSGFRFTALASDAALAVEGAAMAHCIGSYGRHCRAGMLRAFSVRYGKTGERVASLTVEESAPGCWAIAEINGFANASPPARVDQAAFAVVQAMEDAYRLSRPTRSAMDVFRREAAAQARCNLEMEDCETLF